MNQNKSKETSQTGAKFLLKQEPLQEPADHNGRSFIINTKYVAIVNTIRFHSVTILSNKFQHKMSSSLIRYDVLFIELECITWMH